MTVYRVRPGHRYLDTEAGGTFVADLPADQEERGIARGAIEIIERQPLTVDPRRLRMPDTQPRLREGD